MSDFRVSTAIGKVFVWERKVNSEHLWLYESFWKIYKVSALVCKFVLHLNTVLSFKATDKYKNLQLLKVIVLKSM